MGLALGRDRTVATIHPGAELVPIVRFEPGELDAIQLILRGTSVVDWFCLHFRNREEIEAFIRLHEFDLSKAVDRSHLDGLQRRALSYLREHLRYRRIPEAVMKCDVAGLLDYASGKGRRAYRFYACLVLKVMHLLHYITAHDLLSSLPVTQAEISVLLHAKVERVVRGLLERNFPIVAFSGNTKTHHSVVSKLLAKRESQAAQVFDKLRFRFVVARLEDVPPLLVALSRELVPFNYIVPDQAKNTLVDLPKMLVRAGNLHAIRALRSDPKDSGIPLNEPMAAFETGRRNDLSGPDYRVVNFVAEIPVRLDGMVWEQSVGGGARGPVVFGTVEFQVVDDLTAHRNETGPNRHSLYKGRQRARVRSRLERGKRGLRSSSSAPEAQSTRAEGDAEGGG